MTDTDTHADLQAVTDQLYGLPLDDFMSARDAAARSAKDEGKSALAKEIGKLRKPTQSAWLVNLVWRDQREVMQQLFDLAHELSEAQAEAAGPALRQLTQQRRQMEHALMRRAVELADEAGVKISESVARETQETLGAALAVPEVADEVRSGRLVKPASYAGFGSPPTTSPRPLSTAPRPPIDLQAARQRANATKESTEEDERQRHAEAERQAREAAERRLAGAREAAKTARAQLDTLARGAEQAHQRHADLHQRLESLREQLRKAESEAQDAERNATAADAAHDAAEKAVAEAERAVEAAEKDLNP